MSARNNSYAVRLQMFNSTLIISEKYLTIRLHSKHNEQLSSERAEITVAFELAFSYLNGNVIESIRWATWERHLLSHRRLDLRKPIAERPSRSGRLRCVLYEDDDCCDRLLLITKVATSSELENSTLYSMLFFKVWCAYRLSDKLLSCLYVTRQNIVSYWFLDTSHFRSASPSRCRPPAARTRLPMSPKIISK